MMADGSFRTMNPAQTPHDPKPVLQHEALVTSLSPALLLAAQHPGFHTGFLLGWLLVTHAFGTQKENDDHMNMEKYDS